MSRQADVDVANEALAAFGAGEIVTFDDATLRARAVKRIYWSTINGLQSSYPWQMCRDIMQLTPLDETAMADSYFIEGWRYVYGLPAIGASGGILRTPVKYLATPNRASDPIKDFEVYNNRVYCDLDTCFAQVLLGAAPTQWPSYFRNAAVAVLAYKLIMPISGNSGLRDSLKEEAVGTPEQGGIGGLVGLARTADSVNDSSDTLGVRSPLTDARY